MSITDDTLVYAVNNRDDWFFVAEEGEEWPEYVWAEQCDSCGLCPFTLDEKRRTYACAGTDTYGDGEWHEGCGEIYRPRLKEARYVVFNR